MRLPELPVKRAKMERQTVAFGGLDWREGAAEGTLSDCQNLSSALWPALSQRGGRTVYGSYAAPTSLFAWEKLCVVDGTRFLYGGELVGTVTPGEKQMTVVNTKLCIFPDKKYLDLERMELLELEASLAIPAGAARFTDRALQIDPSPVLQRDVTKRIGIFDLQDITVKAGYYDDPVRWDGIQWVTSVFREARGMEIATLQDPNLLVGKYVIPGVNSGGGYELPVDLSDAAYPAENRKGVYGIITSTRAVRFQGKYEEKQEIGTRWEVSVNLYQGARTQPALDGILKKGDGVEISGAVRLPNNNKTAVIRGVTPDTLVFDGNLFMEGAETGALAISRKVPDLEYVCERDNRLWGCAGTTIYASALGDPGNFDVFDGLATDGYAVAVGTEGPFTGCVGYSSGALFFKERCVHKLLGTSPKNYQMNTQRVHGVQKGSHRSLCIVNEVLYYKGVDGVYAYSGGTPQPISTPLGDRHFFDASGGCDGRRYYLSMRDGAGAWNLLVYDLSSGLWLREAGERVPDFALVEGKLHLLSGDTVYIAETGDFDETWSAVLNPLHEAQLGRKRYVRVCLRLELSPGAWVRVETRTDGGLWRQAWTSPDHRRRVTMVPLRPTRCDSLEIRLSGRGKCLVRSMERSFDVGGIGQ